MHAAVLTSGKNQTSGCTKSNTTVNFVVKNQQKTCFHAVFRWCMLGFGRNVGGVRVCRNRDRILLTATATVTVVLQRTRDPGGLSEVLRAMPSSTHLATQPWQYHDGMLLDSARV